MSTSRAAWVALLLAGCASNRGPQDMEGIVTPLTLEPPPVYALLGARSELNLTSEQVATLDSIAAAVQVENRPLIDQLMETSGGSRQPGTFRVRPEGEPILESIRANHRRANEGVAAALSEEQKATVCRLFSRPAGGPGQRGRGPGRAPAQMPGDSAGARRGGPPGMQVWTWCGPAPSTEIATPAEGA